MFSLAYRFITIMCCSSVGFLLMISSNSWAMQLNSTPSNPSMLLQSPSLPSIKSPTLTSLKLISTSSDVVLKSPLQFQALPTQSNHSILKYNVFEEFKQNWQAEVHLSSSVPWSSVNGNHDSNFTPNDDPVEIPESYSPLGMIIGELGLLVAVLIKFLVKH